VLGGIVVAVLGILLLRLWTMQVLSGPAYARDAEQNRVQEFSTVAPRGRILDRKGRELVTNRATLAVVVSPTAKDNDAMLTRLSSLLNVPLPEIKERVGSVREVALAPRVVAIDVPLETVAYLSENEREFPGVEVQTRAIREYPQGGLAAHVLGYTGEIAESEVNEPEFAGYHPNDIVGKAGAEKSFEKALQGDRGRKVLEVDAAGNPRRVIKETDPEPGRDVMLTIDSRVQKVAEHALADALVDARHEDYPKARAGAAVALDIRSGEARVGEPPTYDLSVRRRRF
jgi:penicillin-binding protein 2